MTCVADKQPNGADHCRCNACQLERVLRGARARMDELGIPHGSWWVYEHTKELAA